MEKKTNSPATPSKKKELKNFSAYEEISNLRKTIFPELKYLKDLCNNLHLDNLVVKNEINNLYSANYKEADKLEKLLKGFHNLKGHKNYVNTSIRELHTKLAQQETFARVNIRILQALLILQAFALIFYKGF